MRKVRKSMTVVIAFAANFVVNAATYYAAPNGSDAEDCPCTEEQPGTIRRACSLLTAGSGTADSQRNWVVLKAGTPQAPAVYDLSNETGVTDYATITAKNTGIRSEAADADYRRIVIRGNGFEGNMRFLCAYNYSGYKWDKIDIVLRGVTLEGFGRNAPAVGSSGPSADTGCGGAICGNDAFTATNCMFRFNKALVGGAVWKGKYYNCYFEANTNTVSSGDYGGGAANDIGLADNCDFVDNYGLTGSAVSSGGWANQTIRNCRFVGQSGSEAVSARANKCEIYDSLFYGNTERACYSVNKIITAYNCTFVSNCCTAVNYRSGGAATYGGLYYDCVYSNNYVIGQGAACNQSGTHIRGIYSNNHAPVDGVLVACQSEMFDCVISNHAGSAASLLREGAISNCLITANHLVSGVLFEGGSSDSRDSVIVGNSTSSRLLKGVSFVNCLIKDNLSGDVTLMSSPMLNCTVVNNTVTNNTGAITANMWNSPSTDYTIRNCIVVGNLPNDFRQSPLIVDYCVYGTIQNGVLKDSSNNVYPVENSKQVTDARLTTVPDELHPYAAAPLGSRSPSVDCGNNGWVTCTSDLTGILPRISGNSVDAGCYEFIPTYGLTIFVR